MLAKLIDKYRGCLLGAAIGDAIGKQNEGLKRSEILSRGYIHDYGRAWAGSPGEKLREGQYTDDTEQMLVLAQSIIECGGLDVLDFAERLMKWGVQALEDPLRKSLIGPSSSIAISRLKAGISWKYSGAPNPSCGSSMRVAPIGLFYKELDEIEANAALSSIPTHNSKEAIGGAVAVAIGVRCAVEDKNCAEIIKETSARASKFHTGLAERISFSFRKRKAEPQTVFEEIGTSYLVYETVPSAFYCFSRYFEQPEKAVLEAVNAGGDTDSIACITGALCGALHGVHSFPDRWIKGLENKDPILHIARKIFEKSISESTESLIF